MAGRNHSAVRNKLPGPEPIIAGSGDMIHISCAGLFCFWSGAPQCPLSERFAVGRCCREGTIREGSVETGPTVVSRVIRVPALADPWAAPGEREGEGAGVRLGDSVVGRGWSPLVPGFEVDFHPVARQPSPGATTAPSATNFQVRSPSSRSPHTIANRRRRGRDFVLCPPTPVPRTQVRLLHEPPGREPSTHGLRGLFDGLWLRRERGLSDHTAAAARK